MNLERRPIYRKGERNAFCPFYGLCLDEAVKGAWAFWDCSECENRLTRDSKTEGVNPMYGDSMEVHDLPSGMDDVG